MKRLFIALAVCGFIGVASPALAADGTISGTITHAVGGTAVGEISVSIQNADTLAYDATTSAVDGTYSKSVAPGTYIVTTSTSYDGEANIIFIKKTATVTVASGETKSGINLALTRRGRFTGHVYASDGVTAITSASVSVDYATDSSSGSDSATTDATGLYYSSPGPDDNTVSAVGIYNIVASKTGYFSSQVSGVTLAADETTVTQDILLTPASTVSGTITDAAGTALENATVRLSNDVTGTSGSARTNALGAYTVSIVNLYEYNESAIGDYSVSVSKVGYITHTASLTITTESSALTGKNYSLSAAGSITGTVKTSTGTALKNASVSANNEYGQTCYGTTNASGVYALTGCYPSSQFTVIASKTSYVSQKTYSITVTSGTTTSGINFILQSGKTYSGTVVAKGTGAPIAGADISLYRRNQARSEYSSFSLSSRSDGSFSVNSLPPGKYRVKVTKPGYITNLQESVTITSNVTGRRIILDLGSSIYGLVYTGKSSAIAGATIDVYAINNGKEVSFTSTTVDEAGYYLITGLKKGTYRLKITSTDYVTQVVTLSVKASSKLTKNLKLAVAGSISGYVTDKATGLPVAALVRVVGTSITMMSDSNGYYILDGVTPGKRKVVVSSAYYNTSEQKSVAVSAGKMKAGLNFTITPK